MIVYHAPRPTFQYYKAHGRPADKKPEFPSNAFISVSNVCAMLGAVVLVSTMVSVAGGFGAAVLTHP